MAKVRNEACQSKLEAGCRDKFQSKCNRKASLLTLRCSMLRSWLVTPVAAVALHPALASGADSHTFGWRPPAV